MNKGARSNFFRSFVGLLRAFWTPIGNARRPSQQNQFVMYWRAFLVLPIIPCIIQFFLLVLFWLLASSHALASNLTIDDNLPYQHYQNGYVNSYCLFTYDVIGPDENIYTCKQVRTHPVSVSSPNSGYDPVIAGRHYCWQYHWGGWYYGTGSTGWNGIILHSEVKFSMARPDYTPAAPCIKKSDSSPPLQCNINLQSVINGAFSNKFPLDLFSGFDSATPAPSACPSFTVEGQTFQLCYINQLTAMLKYVLLLVFIISSVIAL
jgi:hypothetical protein